MEERQPLITLGCFTFLMVLFVNGKLEILLAAIRFRGSRQEGLGLIEKGELDTAKKDLTETERMLKALIKSL